MAVTTWLKKASFIGACSNNTTDAETKVTRKRAKEKKKGKTAKLKTIIIYDSSGTTFDPPGNKTSDHSVPANGSHN